MPEIVMSQKAFGRGEAPETGPRDWNDNAEDSAYPIHDDPSSESSEGLIDSENDVLLPTLITGTSREYLGRRPLPRSVRERIVVIITGPTGVGKTSVALRIAGEGAVHLEGRSLNSATVSRARLMRWPDRFLNAPSLVLDGPVFLGNRPGVAKALRELICARSQSCRKTILCEGDPRDGSIALLMDAVEPSHRATLTLRFPVGTGKRRFVKGLCKELGIDLRNMTSLLQIEPWSYAAVIRAAEGLLPRDTTTPDTACADPVS